MKYATVCSGIEAPSVAWHPLGWLPVFFSDIEPFPSTVLAHHYPTVPNLGDMTKFKEWPDAELDLICGGTPCQSFSVAGLRKGLDDPRGNLMLTYLAITARYRPRWLVWENVPGVLSSGGGNDFASLLRGLGKLGYGFAYRILDAQYFGVPQRRRRVFVVGYLGDWRRAAAVLFERHSLQGHPAPRREAGKVVAPTVDGSAGRSGETNFHTSGGLVPEICPTLRAGGNKTGGDRPSGTDVDTSDSLICMASGQGNSEIGKNVSTMRGEGFDASEDGTGRGTSLVPVAFAQNQRDEVRIMDVAAALAREPGMNQQTYLQQAMQVRRLTPRECERLQGFPDDFTLIQMRGKPAADGPRYKALGNSMAVSVIRWIGERIAMVDAIQTKGAT